MTPCASDAQQCLSRALSYVENLAGMNDITLIGDNLLIAFDYDATRVQAVKGHRIGAWTARRPVLQPATHTWSLPRRCAADVAKVFFDLKWCDKLRDYMRRSRAKFETADTVLAGLRQHELELFAEQVRQNGARLDAPLPDGRTLRLHQQQGVINMAQLLRVNPRLGNGHRQDAGRANARQAHV